MLGQWHMQWDDDDNVDKSVLVVTKFKDPTQGHMEMDGWIETCERPQHTPVYIMYPELALES